MFDRKAVKKTQALGSEKNTVPCLLTRVDKSEVFRFLIPIVTTSEEWSNTLSSVTPYKRYSLIDFQSRDLDKFSFDAILTTRSRSRSIQPLLDKLKACMIPESASNNKKDDVNPPILSLVIGETVYKNLYLASTKIEVKERLNGHPTYADVNLSFISSFIETSQVR
jgi:hypothetical protein